MAIPARAAGYGNLSQARNVFRVQFDQPLSAPVQYEMYDGGAFPLISGLTTNKNDCFVGTLENGGRPMYSLLDTTGAAPLEGAWKPAEATPGAANPNRMNGQASCVQQGGANVGAGGSITFNMVLEVPADASTASKVSAELLLRYTYSGSAPNLSWFVNDAGAGGTEGSPVWTPFTPGKHGTRHCRGDVEAGGPYLADIPDRGTLDTVAGWVAP